MLPTDNRSHSAKYLKKTEVAENTFEFRFKIEHPFFYEAGQYVWVQLPTMKYPDVRGDRRAFSIVNPQDGSGEVSILFRKGESGFKKTLFELESGDEVAVIGPFGVSFCTPEDDATPLILLSGGVGIAPFVCLIRDALQKNVLRPITLICADESEARIAYRDELAAIEKTLPSFRSIFVTKTLQWEDVKDAPKLSESLVYVSGTQGFVDYAHECLKKNGVFEDQFRFENFYPTEKNTNILHQVFKEQPRSSALEISPTEQRIGIFLNAIQGSSNHIIVTDKNGIVVFCNNAAEKMTGYTFSEMQNQTPRLWGGLMPVSFYKDAWKKLLNGETVDTEVVNRRKNGALYTVVAHISPIKNAADEIIGFIGTEEDITQIRETEQQARTNEERFRQLTERISEIFWITELQPSERIVYISPAFEKIWGVPAHELYANARVWSDRIHPDDKVRVSEVFNTFVRGEGEYNLEYRVVNGENVFWIKDQGEVIKDRTGKPARIVGVARDITEEKMVDQAKTDFVSLASHQLKTPIGAISWDAEMLLNGDYGKLSEKQKEIIGEMYHTNMRMKELVDGLLSVSRIDLGTFMIEPEPVRFADMCDEVITELTPRIEEKQHVLSREYSADIPPIPADPKLLRIIFQNFLSNAVKYTPHHGHIRIVIRIENHEIAIRVFNNGVGIPKQEQAKIFTKLFRASNAQEMDTDGTGLGLYIVKSIIDAAGGRLWFFSEKGQETEFGVAFPLSGMKKRSGTKKLV